MPGKAPTGRLAPWRRLEWRSRHVPVNSHRIYFYTFDDLLRDLRGRLEDFQAWATRPPES